MGGLNARLARLKQHHLTLPLSLRAFYEIVGSVNLVGAPPTSWGCYPEELEALQIVPFDDELVQLCLEEEEEEDADQPLEEPWIMLSPDDRLKYNYSGSGAYQMRLLEGAVADCEIDELWPQMSLVEYLRLACAGGGFPGMARLKKRPEQDLAFLTADLLPF